MPSADSRPSPRVTWVVRPLARCRLHQGQPRAYRRRVHCRRQAGLRQPGERPQSPNALPIPPPAFGRSPVRIPYTCRVIRPTPTISICPPIPLPRSLKRRPHGAQLRLSRPDPPPSLRERPREDARLEPPVDLRHPGRPGALSGPAASVPNLLDANLKLDVNVTSTNRVAVDLAGHPAHHQPGHSRNVDICNVLVPLGRAVSASARPSRLSCRRSSPAPSSRRACSTRSPAMPSTRRPSRSHR